MDFVTLVVVIIISMWAGSTQCARVTKKYVLFFSYFVLIYMPEINLQKYTQSAERLRGNKDGPQIGDVGAEPEPVTRNQDARPSRSSRTGIRYHAGPAGRASDNVLTARSPRAGALASLPHAGCAGPTELGTKKTEQSIST